MLRNIDDKNNKYQIKACKINENHAPASFFFFQMTAFGSDLVDSFFDLKFATWFTPYHAGENKKNLAFIYPMMENAFTDDREVFVYGFPRPISTYFSVVSSFSPSIWVLQLTSVVSIVLIFLCVHWVYSEKMKEEKLARPRVGRVEIVLKLLETMVEPNTLDFAAFCVF